MGNGPGDGSGWGEGSQPTRGRPFKLYACAAQILCTPMKLAWQKCRGK